MSHSWDDRDRPMLWERLRCWLLFHKWDALEQEHLWECERCGEILDPQRMWGQ